MIAIIDYNAGNIRSVKNALDQLGCENCVTDDLDVIRSADKVIFPGVGEASTTMRFLKEKKLDELIPSLKQPFLGICLGMQLMCKYSEEGNTDCLGIFDVQVKKFPPEDNVPHVGWNNLGQLKGDLFQGIKNSNDVYFVHSFYAEISEETIAECDYILPFSAAIQKDNFYATQFHPEKSAGVGNLILQNFISL